MNYDQRAQLQKRLKDFTDEELQELLDCVLNKELNERKERYTKIRMNELFL